MEFASERIRSKEPIPETNHMKTKYLLAVIAAAFGALTILPTRVQANAIAYTVTHLGTLGGTADSYPLGINATGQIAGDSFLAGNSAIRAARWTGTTPTNLGTLGGPESHATGINATGQVAGYSSITGNTAIHATRWTGTTAQDLGTLGGSSSLGYDINDFGQVTGYSNLTGNSADHAVRWTGTTPTDLGTLGGSSSYGNDINDSGQVAGWAFTLSNAKHAVLWTGTTPTDLGTLGGSLSAAYALNNAGDVIGLSYLAGDTVTHAFLYTGGTMYDLNDLILPGSGVTNFSISGFGGGINDSGQIAATDTINGQRHALRLTPTPEPSSALLLLASTGLLAGFRRSRRTSPTPTHPSLN